MKRLLKSGLKLTPLIGDGNYYKRAKVYTFALLFKLYNQEVIAMASIYINENGAYLHKKGGRLIIEKNDIIIKE